MKIGKLEKDKDESLRKIEVEKGRDESVKKIEELEERQR